MTTLKFASSNSRSIGGGGRRDRASYDQIFNDLSDNEQYSTDQDSPDPESMGLDYKGYSSSEQHDNSLHNSCYYLSQITEQNPYKWNKKQIKLWLKHKHLYHLYQLEPLQNCVKGRDLLRLNTKDFDYNDSIEKLFRYIL